MLLIPAIDIKDNCCVRLIKGKFKNISLFSKNPRILYNNLLNKNAKRIHIVDLDGAIHGKPKNLFFIKSMINYSNLEVPIQLGGGIRSLEVMNYYFDIGIRYLILSTKILNDIDFFYNVCEKFPNKIILGFDVRNQKLAVNGWENTLNINFKKFLLNIKDFQFESIICTDINKDGMLEGINFDILLKISNIINKPIIASGGLKDINDIIKINNLQYLNLLGLICGKSIYTGNLNFKNIQNKLNIINNCFI